MSAMTCKYTSQFDGTTRCSEPVSDLGFCTFHREAVDRGDIDLDGVMSDSCQDQVRRRAINYHGMPGLPPNPDGLPR
jgi:hypothetical protein